MERFENFTSLVANINRNIQKIKQVEMDEFGLRSIHVSVIYYLYKSDTLTNKQLQESCNEDKAQISRVLNELENLGIVITDNKEKKYKYNLYLSETGKSIGLRINEKINDIFEHCSKDVLEEERARFYQLLESISNNMDDYINKRGK